MRYLRTTLALCILLLSCVAWGSNEIKATDTSGKTLYQLILTPTGLLYTAGGNVTLNNANWQSSAAMSEQGTTRIYYGTFPPAIVTAGRYTVLVYEQQGGAPAVTDVLVSSGAIDWNGNTVASLVSGATVGHDFTQVLPALPTTNTVGQAFFGAAQRVGRQSTAQGGTVSTITLDAAASAVDNIYASHGIRISSGTGAGQFATILSYVGSTKVATITRPGPGQWTTTPDATSVFWIEPVPYATVQTNLDKNGYGLSATQTYNNLGQTTKQAATLASGDVTGNLPANVAQIAGQTANAAAAVTFPTTIGTSTFAVGQNVGSATSVTGNVGGISGITFPTNFNLLSIDASGRLVLTPTEHGLFAGDVFGATAASFNTAGSFGQKLNAAGSAGDPWTTNIATGYSGNQAGALMYGMTQAYAQRGTAPSWYTAPSDVFAAAKGTYGAGTWGNYFALQLANAVPNDYQQRGQPVQLPVTPPTGYGFSGLSSGDIAAIATGVLGATIDGSLTFKQVQALSEAFMNGRFTISDSTSSPYVRTVTYFRFDGTTPLAVQPTTYTDSTFGKVAPGGRAKPTFSNLP